MPCCVLYKCRNHSGQKNKTHGITFHSFPQDDLWRHEWTLFVRKQRHEPDWTPTNSSRICSKHFKLADIYSTSKGLKRISKGAVPYFTKSDDSKEKIEETADEEEFNSGETDNSKNTPHDINDIKINYNNIDKFGKQIAFLLKRIPRQLCRELQEGIVTLVKTATKKYKNETKTNVTASTSTITKKGKTPISRPALTPTLETKPKADEEMTIEGPENISNKVKTLVDETTQATQYLETQLRTSTNQSTSRIRTVPEPIVLPIEFFGSMDYIKQEVFDPEDIAAEEQYSKATTSEQISFDPLKTDIKIEIEEKDLPKANRKENSRDKYD